MKVNNVLVIQAKSDMKESEIGHCTGMEHCVLRSVSAGE